MSERESTCIRIGGGIVAALHELKLRSAGVRLLGVLDIDANKHELAARAGYTVLHSYAEAARLEPAFWDICVDTQHHVGVLQQILAVDPAANVMIEKPVCRWVDIPVLRHLVGSVARGRIAVNENYSASTVTAAVKDIAFGRLGLRPRRIIVEMTKNRGPDFVRGRFVDRDFAAFGYEGPHMLAILHHLGEEYVRGKLLHAELCDAVVTTPTGSQVLAGQGGASVRYLASSGVEVELYTSMDGAVKYGYSPSGGGIDGFRIEAGDARRHRVLAVEGTNRHGDECVVAGFYEPVHGLNRSEGAVVTLNNGAVVDVIGPIDDDTMAAQMSRILRYFQDGGSNPGDVGAAIGMVEVLHEARRRADLGSAGEKTI